MSAFRIRLDGFEELRAALRVLPAELTTEATQIVYENADRAEAEIRAGYPQRTKNLKQGLKTTRTRAQFSVKAVVKNTSTHAVEFENGTEVRRNAIGANRGRMPPGHVFVPIAIRQRRIMNENLRHLVITHGLLVTGDA